MTEPKPIWIAGYQPTGKAPDELHPPSGGSGVQHPFTIDGEPLSTKQLHELITSQAMTIDRLLGEVGQLNNEIELLQTNRRLLNRDVERYRAKNNHVCEWTGKHKYYHEITGDTLFRVRKTSCSDEHDDIVSVVDYTFCPNCGGQIKYIEET